VPLIPTEEPYNLSSERLNEMRSEKLNMFWWYWLLVAIVGLILFGSAFIFLQDLMQGLFNWIFSPTVDSRRYTPEAVTSLKFAYGVLGAVMIGWAINLLMVLFGAFRRSEREGWNGIALSMVIWYVVDTTFSLVSGFFGNAILNTLLFVMFAVPLAATYRHFHGAAKPVLQA
jgi:hypothetical protein